MDAGLIGAYRMIWTDIVLINDACKTCYAMNCLTLKNVGRALELIVLHESDLVYKITSGLQEDTEDSGHVLEGNELSTESLVYVAWEFVHGVFLNFAVEELSQYPFWVAKTISVVNPSPDHLFYALGGWMFTIGDIYSAGGVLSLFKGVVPYLVNRGVESYQHLEKSIRHFLDSAGRKLERTAHSIDVSKIKEPSQYASKRSSTKAAESNNSKNKKKIVKKGPPTEKKPSYLRRLAVSAMCHPLLLQAVRMVTDKDVTHRNWLLSYISMVSTGGIRSLYKGLTSSMLFGLLPIPIIMYYGVVETVIYKRMAGQGTADRFGGGLSVLSNLLFNYNPVPDAAALAAASGDSSGAVSTVLSALYKPMHVISIFKYGLMTMGQIVPGFFSFALSRIVMSATLGETPQRHREISIRKKILRDYLIDNPAPKKGKKVSINSHYHAEIQAMHARKRGAYNGREYGRHVNSGTNDYGGTNGSSENYSKYSSFKRRNGEPHLSVDDD